nr:R2-like ligand-binding oxidase [Peribacillus faecalis]
MSKERVIITTSAKGLDEESFPYKLYQKAKKFGIWNPSDIDFTQDAKDWAELSDAKKAGILRLIAQFQAGEEAVTLDLLPLIMAIAKEGRLEEEMFLTTFLYEEAKHTEFFRLVLDAIGEKDDLSHLHTGAYKEVFYEVLPEAMERLSEDQSPRAQAEAATVYNMFVEGVLAETGYFSFYNALEEAGIMPGLLKGIGYLKKDESRHIAYGTYLLQRLIKEQPELFDVVTQKMEELAVYAYKINQEGAEASEDPDNNPELTLHFMMQQLSVRMQILARAKDQEVDEILIDI